MAKEKRQQEEAKPGERGMLSSLARVVGSILAAFLLFGALTSIMDMFALPIEQAFGCMRDLHDLPYSVERPIGWSVAAFLAWRLLKPSVRVWTCFFGLFAFLMFVSFLTRADTQEEQISLDAGKGTFVICAIVTVVGIIRLTLGEGRQQSAALKQLIGLSSPELSALPEDSLLRASAQPELPHDTLLRPAKDATETEPEQLLRASQSKGRADPLDLHE